MEWGCRPLDLAEMGGEDAEGGVVEARAHGSNPAQPVIVIETDQDRAESGRPTAFAGEIAAHHRPQPASHGYLPPVGRSSTWQIWRPEPLPDDALEVRGPGELEQCVPVLRGRRRDHDRRRQGEFHQPSDSLLIGAAEQALTGIQQVEYHEIDPDVRLCATAPEPRALLEIGEGGLSVLVEGDHLAVDCHPVG